MSKKEATEAKVKEPRTIRVVTLVKAAIITSAIAGAFVGGMVFNQNRTDSFNKAAIEQGRQYVEQLKSSQ